ncbi:selT/selW/selH seleno protein domain-containing protein [Radiomyces spectabilis]|uniref:selT/selW/selH seleno protein domain-containing protein n=1 Tax=Radiomyces spectabilis TaxID=64574 RepID=UPI00221EB48A|nr:selT/selW/selH seleno protein domain-containing protein [Radiomyces spectabilis]KAI8379666.1 selT/selW/selH seleno protein domain-containing protein [Radiomyces spectabilis]
METQITEKKPRVSIEYCPKCRWLLRAAWLAQELLTTFETVIGEVALIPGDVGVFQVKVENEIVWDRKTEGRFPEAKELKQVVRDVIAPGKSLGHSDRKEQQPASS